MGWLKRNLFFVIGVVVALGLLGAAGFYDYAGWTHNQAAFDKLNGVYSQWSTAARTTPSPGSGAVDNIAAAKDQEARLRQWINQTTNYFQPVAPIPRPANGQVSGELFAGALHQTVAQLQLDATNANVALPPQFDFSFTAHMDRLTFALGSLDPLSVQLGEVKAISEILFGTGINAMDGIQRVPVSPDDASGSQTDYLTDQPVTNDLAVLVPYAVTFRGFSPEIARVLVAFASSPNGFIVKNISIQPAGAATDIQPGGAAGTDPNAPQMPAPMPGKGGLQTVLNEQLLRVTLTVELVKLTPKN